MKKAARRKATKLKAGRLPEPRFPMGGQKPRVLPGGTAREATAIQFPISKSLAGVLMTQGDVGFAPMGDGHSLENDGDTPCQVILVFNSGEYQEISLSTWLASNPRQLLETNLGLPRQTIAKFPRKQEFIAR